MRQVKEEFTNYVFSEVVAPISKANYQVGDPTLNIDDLPEETDKGYAGDVQGKLEFYDGSWLQFIEHIELSYNTKLDCLDVDRPFYKYNYHGSDKKLKIAYHCGPPEKLYKRLKSFPHHKHIGSEFTEGNKDVKIKDILNEIEDEIENNL